MRKGLVWDDKNKLYVPNSVYFLDDLVETMVLIIILMSTFSFFIIMAINDLIETYLILSILIVCSLIKISIGKYYKKSKRL